MSGAATAREPASAAPAGAAAAGAAPHPTWRHWVGVMAMVTGLFLSIMDVQIVTSSLTQIAGGLSASTEEIAWVQTAYLIAHVVMVPFTGTLSRLLSTRIVFVGAALGFTGASVLCATATSLGEMILWRAAQGFFGGAITPSVFPVIYTLFRGKQLAMAMVMVSVILNLSSTLGPTIGGYLTETLSWHWLFLVNIPFGIGVAIIVWLTIDIDKPDWSLLRYFDVIGLVLMGLFFGCLEYTLQEGPRWDWFDDQSILIATVVSAVSGFFFFWRMLTFRQPIVDLRVYLNRNFSLGSFYTFVIGTGLYGATYVVPLFLAQVRGFNAMQIGQTVVVTGLAQMAMSPFSAWIARNIDLRLMLAIGMATFAVSMYLTATLTNQAGFAELLVPQMLRGFALMFCFLPANLIALGTVPQDQLKNAAGLYNLMRDLGGALGLAMISTIMSRRYDFHWSRLTEDVNPARPSVQQFLEMQTRRLETLIPGDPHQGALKLLARLVHREALTGIGFLDHMLEQLSRTA
jgi:MFS transporter, DHA2 family, multidrug resistance protein